MKNKSCSRIKLLVWCAGFSATVFLTASRADTSPQDTPQQESLPSIKALEPLDSTRDIISHQLIRFADSIDTFFAGDRVYDELQESHIKVYLLQTNVENEKPLYETKVKAKLVFPKTQERLKLLIESDDEDEEDSKAQQESVVSAAEETDQSIGLRFIEKDTESWRVQTDALLRFPSTGVETVARLRLRKRIILGDWLYRISENISWNSREGSKETTRLNIDNRFAINWLFRSSTFARWKNINGYFDYGQDLLLFQNISKRKALTYQTGVRGITEDSPHTTDYFISARYREQVHQGWLFYEIIPAIHHPVEEDYKPVRSLSFKLEIVFDEN